MRTVTIQLTREEYELLIECMDLCIEHLEEYSYYTHDAEILKNRLKEIGG
jgi:hypothetical protein